MNQTKKEVNIKEKNDYWEDLLSEALEDIKNNNVMTLEELKRDVATWK